MRVIQKLIPVSRCWSDEWVYEAEKLSLALVWHLRQVAVTLALFTVDFASRTVRTACASWQSAQVGAFALRLSVASPW